MSESTKPAVILPGDRKPGSVWMLESLDVSHDYRQIGNKRARVNTDITVSVKVGQGTLVNVVVSPAAVEQITNICLMEVAKALDNA